MPIILCQKVHLESNLQKLTSPKYGLQLETFGNRQNTFLHKLPETPRSVIFDILAFRK